MSQKSTSEKFAARAGITCLGMIAVVVIAACIIIIVQFCKA